jgi:hypothetical protein
MTNALPPAHWAADPSGRHEYRYWDGTRWTDHVADQGRTGVDPVAGGAPATTSEPTATTQATTTPEATTTAEAVTPAPATTPPASGPGATTPAGDTPTIAWRADATDPSPAPSAEVAGPTAGTEPVTWPPGPADDQPGYAAAVVAPPPPPPVAGTGVVPTGRVPVYGARSWRSMNGLKTALVVLFVGMALSSVGLLATAGNRIRAIDDFQENPTFTNARSLQDADDAISAASGIYTIIRVAIFVVFIIWLWRGAKNALDVLGREAPAFTPGWSIGSWFIPLANFVIPVMIVQGLWRASAPGTGPGTAWRKTKGSVLVGFWWAAFLLSIVSAFSVGDDGKLDDVKSADGVVSLGALGSLVAAILAILVVVQLTRRFDERRAEELGA